MLRVKPIILTAIMALHMSFGAAMAQQDRATECGGGYITGIMFNTNSGAGQVPAQQYNTANVMVSLDYSLQGVSNDVVYVRYPNDYTNWIYIGYSGGNAPDNSFNGSQKYENLRSTLEQAYLAGAPVRIEMSKPTTGNNANKYACINTADQVNVWVCNSANTTDCKAPPPSK